MVKTVYFIGPEVAGFLTALENSFVSNGLRVKKFYFSNPLSYGISLDLNNGLTKMTIDLGTRYLKTISKFGVSQALIRFIRFTKILLNADAIIFNYGTTIFNHSSELLCYKILKIRTIFVFHGSEIRPIYLNGKEFSDETSGEFIKSAAKLVFRQRRLAARAEKYADAIVAWAGITHFFSKPLFLHEVIGFPIKIPTTRNLSPPPPGYF